MRILAVGDIHGVYDKVRQLDSYFSKVDLVVFVGDYVDRGPQPIDVLNYCASVPNSIRLVGNHEFAYLKKIRKEKRVFPEQLTDRDFEAFKTALLNCVGDTRDKQRHYFKTEHVGISHAPAALFQHDWDNVPFDRFFYGWVAGFDAEGKPIRMKLSEKYPGETSDKPVIFGHIHSHVIDVEPNAYCVDLQCGKSDGNGQLGAVIIDDSTVVEKIII